MEKVLGLKPSTVRECTEEVVIGRLMVHSRRLWYTYHWCYPELVKLIRKYADTSTWNIPGLARHGLVYVREVSRRQ